MGLGLPLALITGWFVAQSMNRNPKANHQTDPQAQAKSVQRQAKPKGLNAIEPEQAMERLALSHPRDWRWRLLLAQMKVQQGDRDGAGREITTLKALWPNRPEVQNLQLLWDVGTKRQATALEQTSARFEQTQKGQRLSLGLRLADLQRLSGEHQAAIATYRLIAAESPKTMQPLLALALLHRDKGEIEQSQKVLLSLRNRLGMSAEDKQTLDQLAVRWQLDSFRNSEGGMEQRLERVPIQPTKAPAGTTPKP